MTDPQKPLTIAVIGSGISGLSAAWLLQKAHSVTVFEQDGRIGGHSNTVTVDDPSGPLGIDTGFIVYNTRTYPNLTALFDHLRVPTQASDMSFAVSLRGGACEYAGTSLAALFACRRHLVSPRFWRMLGDLARFYRTAPGDVARHGDMALGDYLTLKGYGAGFRDDHILPMAAAIWSAPAEVLQQYPMADFVRFCTNHGLLQLRNRPQWRTVCGGSRSYVSALVQTLQPGLRAGMAARTVQRQADGVVVVDDTGVAHRFDHVVLACHADQALALIDQPTRAEQRLLSPFAYGRNLAVLHTDVRLMPRRRQVWASWNYIDSPVGDKPTGDQPLCVSYWMNRLQRLNTSRDYMVTLNPPHAPAAGTLLHSETYTHPIFTPDTARAQRQLWTLQGADRLWFCGAYFGAGFHEDGLQAGLAVAEQLGGVRRPWTVDAPSGRIHVGPVPAVRVDA